jgi:hypothetical protein
LKLSHASYQQQEDIEAVFDQDPRVCILQGPVAATRKWSIVKDEPVKDLLGNINKALIQRLPERNYGGRPHYRLPLVVFLILKLILLLHLFFLVFSFFWLACALA